MPRVLAAHTGLWPTVPLNSPTLLALQEMSCQQMLQLAALCPSLSIIDTGDCPADCHAGRSRGVLQDALRALRVDLDVA